MLKNILQRVTFSQFTIVPKYHYIKTYQISIRRIKEGNNVNYMYYIKNYIFQRYIYRYVYIEYLNLSPKDTIYRVYRHVQVIPSNQLHHFAHLYFEIFFLSNLACSFNLFITKVTAPSTLATLLFFPSVYLWMPIIINT